jgi:Phorbol esters/diacylglycerol binding domain (C1 domain)
MAGIPHHWKMVRFNSPTWCSVCMQFVAGVLGKQGMKCVVCKKVAHSMCAEQASVHYGCVGSDVDLSTRLGHHFVKAAFAKPTWCSHCGAFLWGLKKRQGHRCAHCRFVVHSKCLADIDVACHTQSHSVTTSAELLDQQERQVWQGVVLCVRVVP